MVQPRVTHSRSQREGKEKGVKAATHTHTHLMLAKGVKINVGSEGDRAWVEGGSGPS